MVEPFSKKKKHGRAYSFYYSSCKGIFKYYNRGSKIKCMKSHIFTRFKFHSRMSFFFAKIWTLPNEFLFL